MRARDNSAPHPCHAHEWLLGRKLAPAGGSATVDLRRRALLLAGGAGAVTLLFERWAIAEAPSAPVGVQAQITARILPFERGFQGRAQGGVSVVIAEKRGNADSLAAALQMKKALSDIGNISGKPLKIQNTSFDSAKDFVAVCKARGSIVAYLTPGLGSEISQVASGLVGAPILTVAAVEDFVPSGAVLGVKVISGKPRMSINLGQAKAQNLNFPSAVLNLAKIYR